VGDAEAYYRDLIWMRSDTRQALYSSDFLRMLNGFTPMEMVQPYYAQPAQADALSRSQFADIHFYMTDDVLVKVDRMSMAHSLEVRSPLLDHRILEFAATLPADLKINSGQGKVLLRAAAARRLPERIRKMPKRGFSIPAAQWLRAELRETAEAILFDRNVCYDALLDRQTVRRLWNEHLSAARDHSVLLWGLMMLGLWDKTRHRAAA
jgi:asparagine synthase (glutamine-hydrolysing)